MLRYYDPEICRFISNDDVAYIDQEKIGLPDNRTVDNIWFELLAHHIVDSFDIFDLIPNVDVAQMANYSNDKNAIIFDIIHDILRKIVI